MAKNSHVGALSASKYRLYGKTLVLALVFEGAIELIQWFSIFQFDLSQENSELLANSIGGIIFLPIVYAWTLLMAQRDLGPPFASPTQGRFDFQNLLHAVKAWPALIVTSLTVGFIMLGYTAIFILPALALHYFLEVQSPYWLLPYGVIGAAWGVGPLVLAQVLVVVQNLPPYHARVQSRSLTKGKKFQTFVVSLFWVVLPEALSLLEDPLQHALFSKVESSNHLFGLLFRMLLGVWSLFGVLACYYWYEACKSFPPLPASRKDAEI